MNTTMLFICILTFTIFKKSFAINTKFLNANSDAYLTVPEIIKKYGYPSETHVVETSDGYLLEMHRIPHGKNKKYDRSKPPVFLQHSFIGASSDYVILGPNSLAFLLADQGYDVWLSNIRGNKYSMRHRTLPINGKKFWNFSFHENGYYDIPAEIDYVLKHTKQNKVVYVGFSLGTMTFFVMSSLRPEYQNKIKGAILFAPIAYLKHIGNPTRLLAASIKKSRLLPTSFLDEEVRQKSPVLKFVNLLNCKASLIQAKLCANVANLFYGRSNILNEALLPTYLSHSPAGTSIKTLLHLIQMVDTGKFRQYDYGQEKNLKFYNQPTPPDYNLRIIKIPVYLYQGKTDQISTLLDGQALARVLPNATRVVLAPPQFNHLDFILSRNIRKNLYDRVIQQINEIARVIIK